jgi:hypothetical protein
LSIVFAIYIAFHRAIDRAIDTAIDTAIDRAIDTAIDRAIDIAVDMAPLGFYGCIFLVRDGSGRGMGKLYQIGAAGRNLLSVDEAGSLHPGYHLRAPAAVDI